MFTALAGEAFTVMPQFLEAQTHEALLRLAENPASFGVQGDPVTGRQNTGYSRLDLGTRSLNDSSLDALTGRCLSRLGDPAEGRWDRMLLLYPNGSSIPPHIDPPLEAGWAHVRLNAMMITPDSGGFLHLDGREIPLAVGDAIVFRPDRIEHAVSRVHGQRVLWSMGANVR